MNRNTGIVKMYEGRRLLNTQPYYSRTGRRKIINEWVQQYKHASHLAVQPFAIRLGASKEQKKLFYVKMIVRVKEKRPPAIYNNARSPMGIYSSMKDELS